MATPTLARAALALLLVAACSTSEDVAQLGVGDACVLGSDCKAPLVCVFTRCHQQCSESRDCPTGARCVTGEKPEHVCQLEDERACEYTSDCSAPQLCAVDGQCRDQCQTSEDCIVGQVCAGGTCADPSELTDGHLPGEPTVGGAPCVWDSDCSVGMHCKKQTCVFDCLADTDCHHGSACIEHRCVLGASAVECVAGQQPHCTCADGADGVRVCGPDNLWGPCMCPPSGTGGAGGAGGASTSSAGGSGGVGTGGMPTTTGAAGAGGSPATTTGVGGAGGSSTTTTTTAGPGGAGGSSTTNTTTTAGAGGAGGSSTSTTATTTGAGGAGGGLTTTGGTPTVGAGGSGGGITPPSGPGGAPTTASGGGFAAMAIDNGITDPAPIEAWLGAPAGAVLVSFALPGVVTGRAVVDDSGEATLVGQAAPAVALAGEALSSDGDDVVMAWLDGFGVRRARSYPAVGAQSIAAVSADGSGAVAIVGMQASSSVLDFGARSSQPLETTGGFVAVVAPDGRGIWQTPLSSSGLVVPSAVAMDPTGGVVVVGEVSGTLRIGRRSVPPTEGAAAFVARFDADGELSWLRTMGGRGAVSLEAVAADDSGAVIVGGALAGAVEIDAVALQSAGARDVLLLRLDARGLVVDGARFGDRRDQAAHAIALRGDGGLLVAGQMRGTLDLGGDVLESAGGADAFVAAFDARGGHRWSRRLGGAGSDVAVAVAQDGAGEVVVAGDFDRALTTGAAVIGSAGRSDVFVAKLDARGEPIWLRGFGNPSPQHATSLAIAPSDAVVLGFGSARGAIDLGAGPQAGDSYLAVLSP